jgi:hypothetical protein
MQGRQRRLIGRDEAVAQLLEPDLERGQRRAQLVGDVGGELPTGALRSLDLLSRCAQSQGEVGELGWPEIGGTRGVVPGGEPAGRVDVPVDGAGQASGHDHRQDNRGDEGDRRRSQQPGRRDGVVRVGGVGHEVRHDGADEQDRQ